MMQKRLHARRVRTASEQQKAAVLEDVSRLFGVTGVSDRTVVKSG